MLMRNPTTNKTDVLRVLSHKRIDHLRSLIEPFRPDNYTLEQYQERVDHAYKQVRKERAREKRKLRKKQHYQISYRISTDPMSAVSTLRGF